LPLLLISINFFSVIPSHLLLSTKTSPTLSFETGILLMKDFSTDFEKIQRIIRIMLETVEIITNLRFIELKS
jgi:hypothetical protein